MRASLSGCCSAVVAMSLCATPWASAKDGDVARMLDVAGAHGVRAHPDGDTDIAHYVTPRNQGDVVLEIKTPGCRWKEQRHSTNPAVTTVDRSEVGKRELRMKCDEGPDRQVHVWVVWAEIEPRMGRFVALDIEGGIKITRRFDFTAEIRPKQIFTARNRPYLDRPADPPSGHAVCGDSYDAGFPREHRWRWDLSRRIEQAVTVTARGVTSESLCERACRKCPVEFPSEDCTEGNDDGSYDDERGDPYGGRVGVLTSFDQPSRFLEHRIGGPGDEVEIEVRFSEFVRLQLDDDTWQVVSDYCPWRVWFRFRKTAEDNKWINYGSRTMAGAKVPAESTEPDPCVQ